MSAYSDYLRRELKQRATTLSAARKDVADHQTAAMNRQEALEHQEGLFGEAKRATDELEREEGELKRQIEELKDSKEYKDRRDLEGKRETLDALRGQAATGLSKAESHRNAEQRTCSAVLSLLTVARRAAAQAVEHAAAAAERFSDAGLDRLLVPTLPELSEPTTTHATEYVQLVVDPDGIPVSVQRPAPPRFDFDALSAAIQEALAQAERARLVAESRGAVAANLHQIGERLDGELEEIDKLKARADEAAQASKDASERHRQCVLAVTNEATAWLVALAAWSDSCPSTTATLSARPLPPSAIELADDPIPTAKSARIVSLAWTAAAVAEARRDASAAGAQREATLAEHGRVNADLQALVDGGEVLPIRRRRWAGDRWCPRYG